MFKVKSLMLMLLITLIFSVQAEAKEVKPLFGLYKIVSHEVDDLLDQSWTALYMNDKAAKMYPALSKAIDKYRAEIHDSVMARDRKYHEDALTFKQEAPEAFRQFYDKSDIIIRRADSMVLSLIENGEDYMGGAHGMYGYFGVNFDTATGKRLHISDVCTDAEMLLNAIMTRLHEDSPRSPFENAEETIMKQIVEDDLNFTINPAGISVYFNPYEIGSYAEGLFTATILFSEYPSLFKDKYKQLPQSYCEAFPLYGANIMSFSNGIRNYIQVYIDDNGNYSVACGGGVAEDNTGMTGLKEPVLVHMANGKNYLYIDGYVENKGRCIHAYNISDSNIELVSVMPCTFKDMNTVKYETWWLLTDPNDVSFYSFEAIEAGGKSMNQIGIIKADGSLSFS